MFLDLKFHDIPAPGGGRGARRRPAAGRTCSPCMPRWAAWTMMAAAQARSGARGGRVPGAMVPVTLGITVLTSMDDARRLPQRASRAPWPTRWTRWPSPGASRAGISGVVASPHEAAPPARQRWGRTPTSSRRACVPPGREAGDQSRVATPAFAFAKRRLPHRRRAARHAGRRPRGRLRGHRGRAVAPAAALPRGRAVRERGGKTASGVPPDGLPGAGKAPKPGKSGVFVGKPWYLRYVCPTKGRQSRPFPLQCVPTRWNFSKFHASDMALRPKAW